jgi:hypothetical protein
MAQFDPSRIVIFQAGDLSGVAPNQVWTVDATATYAMIDVPIYEESMSGLTMAQQASIHAIRYFPTPADYATRGFPTWAGSDPAPAYFKAVGNTVAAQTTKLRAALAKRYS